MSTNASRVPRILSLIIAVVGVIVFAVGVGVYGYTVAQLKDQHITVAAMDPTAPGSQAGKPVAGPITINAQIKAIEHHIANATGGLTFGQMKSVSSDGKTFSANIAAGVCSANDPGGAKGDALTADCAKYYSGRITAQQGAWTIASLMVSLMALGVATFIAGMGIIVLALGVAIYIVVRPRVVPEVVTKAEAVAEKHTK